MKQFFIFESYHGDDDDEVFLNKISKKLKKEL
jgi:hypothetical protein